MSQRIPIRILPLVAQGRNEVGSEGMLDVDVEALEGALRDRLRGDVSFEPGMRGMYAQDASNYRMMPIGVVCPADDSDVAATLAIARRYGAPVLPRGAGTSIPGQGNNVALMLDFSRHMGRVLAIDPAGKCATVEPGTVLDDLRAQANAHGLTFGPDPATHSRCTLGGMIGNNSCGIHSVAAGRTSDNVQWLEVLTYDGHRMTVGPTSDEEYNAILAEGGRRAEIYRSLRALRDKYGALIRERYPKIPRRVSGYNLDELLPENGFNVARALVGSEGTCAVTLKAGVRLLANPAGRVMLVLGFADSPSAADFVPTVLEFKPSGCEGIDAIFFDYMRRKGMVAKHLDLLPEGGAWLLIEFTGDTVEEATERASKLAAAAKGHASVNLCAEPDRQKHLWGLREAGLGATARVPGLKENWEGWEDTAVHPNVLGAYLRDFQAHMRKFDYTGSFYGHYGDGCVHVRIDFDLRTEEGIARYRRFVEEGADLVKRYGGSLNGEHGDGQSKGELLTRMYGPELVQAFAEFKAIWDPDWRLNPGKLVAAYPLDSNLKLGPSYHPERPATYFKFPDDKGDFSEATLRCVGAGVCRRKSGGVMCPSYMATGEERYSTRGRARLLFEMLQGEPLKGGWKNEEVKEALDLCLACKGCKSDCPVQVDMATYKAEFLAHYYEGRRRPRQAYLFGYIHRWARLAALTPGLANAFARTSFFKILAGIAPQRAMPAFASRRFRKAARPRGGPGPRVILWADTFCENFHPEIGSAALQVLEKAGFAVQVSSPGLCCGRPLYDYGMLDAAKRQLEEILRNLQAEIRAGTPIVVLEPSCGSVFRDELRNLFPENDDAQRLASQTFLLAEFLAKFAPDFVPPRRSGDVLLHGHCHQKSIMGMDATLELVERTGARVFVPESGCCGMAGAFGFEPGERYGVSMTIGERALLPAVRGAPAETAIIADGFSCREQIRQATGRVPVHLAQFLNGD